jgi:hypothetical protein
MIRGGAAQSQPPGEAVSSPVTAGDHLYVRAILKKDSKYPAAQVFFVLFRAKTKLSRLDPVIYKISFPTN